MSNKRKWKVYTTDELKERFQAKPGMQGIPQAALGMPDQGIPAPNLKRRNSAPPGMIHFPPGTFSSSSSSTSSSSASNNGNHHPSHSPQSSHSGYTPSSPHQQHELVTHARGGERGGERGERGSPNTTLSTQGKRDSLSASPYAMPPSRHERRRASLPFLPSAMSSSSSLLGGPPSIEAYLSHLQQIPLAPHPDDVQDEDNSNPPSPSHTLPSFQSLLQTIREDADEEEEELRDIADRANGSPHMQTSKTMPTYINKSPKPPHTFSFNNNNSPQEPSSPSSKFYKNKTLSRSNENLPSLSRMSISDIIS